MKKIDGILVKQLIVLLIILVTALNAQDKVIRSSISGRVIDLTTQQPLPGANIWLLDTNHGGAADKEGNYTINNVPVGRYSITASMMGYKQVTRTDIVVVPNRTAIINFELNVSLIEMPELVIKSEYFTKESDEGVTSTVSIDNQEIAKTPGTPDIFRRLQSVAGVVRASDQSPVLIVRGGSPDENLTLLENIEIYSPFHFASLGGGLENGIGIIEPKLIEDVKLSTGGFSAKYGDRLSSVTQITLREPDKSRVSGDAYINMGGAGAFFTGPLTSKASWMISGRRGIWDLILQMRGEEYYPRTIDLHSKMIYEPTINHKFTFSGVYAQDEVTGIKEEEKEFIGVEKNLRIVKNIAALGINWRWLYSKKGFLLITPYLNLNDWGQKSGPDEDKEKFGYETTENIYGTRAELTYQLSRQHEFIIGGDFKKIESDYTKWAGLDTLRTGVIVQPYKVKFGPEETFKTSSFIQYSITPLFWMQFNLGLRYDYFDYTQESIVNPRLGVSFDISDKLRINFAYGMFSQFPQFYKIFLSPSNKNLKSGKSTHYILGVEYYLNPDLQLKVEGFYKDLKDLPVSESDTSKIYESKGIGYAKGIELSLTQKMSKDLYLFMNYTYSLSRRNDRFTLEEYNFDYDSPHMFNIMATYKLGNWWEFGLIYRYASGLPYTPYDLSTLRQVNGTWYCDEGPKNSERFPDYQRLDIRIDHRFIFSSWNFSIYLEIWNLTNHENVSRYEYSKDFSEKKTVTLFSIMPMIGLAVEF